MGYHSFAPGSESSRVTLHSRRVIQATVNAIRSSAAITVSIDIENAAHVDFLALNGCEAVDKEGLPWR